MITNGRNGIPCICPTKHMQLLCYQPFGNMLGPFTPWAMHGSLERPGPPCRGPQGVGVGRLGGHAEATLLTEGADGLPQDGADLHRRTGRGRHPRRISMGGGGEARVACGRNTRGKARPLKPFGQCVLPWASFSCGRERNACHRIL